jgi:hypothetical protein
LLKVGKKGVDARDNPRIRDGDDAVEAETGAYFPHSQVEASRTLNRNKIKRSTTA